MSLAVKARPMAPRAVKMSQAIIGIRIVDWGPARPVIGTVLEPIQEAPEEVLSPAQRSG